MNWQLVTKAVESVQEAIGSTTVQTAKSVGLAALSVGEKAIIDMSVTGEAISQVATGTVNLCGTAVLSVGETLGNAVNGTAEFTHEAASTVGKTVSNAINDTAEFFESPNGKKLCNVVVKVIVKRGTRLAIEAIPGIGLVAAIVGDIAEEIHGEAGGQVASDITAEVATRLLNAVSETEVS